MEIQKHKKATENINDNFISSMNSIFSAARFFGVVKYEWNICTVYSFLLFLSLTTLVLCAFWKFLKLISSEDVVGGGIMLARLSGLIFYGNALISLILCLKFMIAWKRLSTYWLNIESAIKLKIPADSKIQKRTMFVAIFVGSCAIVEHMLSMMSATGLEIPSEYFFENYLLSSHGFLVQPNEYTLWIAIPIFVLSKLATALWNFQDLLIILISMGLTSRYQRLNLYVIQLVKIEKRLKFSLNFGNKIYLQVQSWRRVREAYARQATLVRTVDRRLGTLVLLSNINNLYFICLQLYLGIHREKGRPIDQVYYMVSLAWLLVRACGVVLAAGDVYIHSRRALSSLYVCPSAAYNVEILRLKFQLINDNVVLTGMGFFSLKRQLLLEVAAAVIKYELVLLQYDH